MMKRGRGRPRKNSVNSGDRGQVTAESGENFDDLPEFFKIYAPAMSSDSLRIPSEFIKKIGENLTTIVTLKGPFGLSWEVHTNRIDDQWFFQEGWPEFVQDNSLEDGDFLIFSYGCNSMFSVKVFARNGCRKRVNSASKLNGKPIEDLKENEASKPAENSHHNEVRGRNSNLKSLLARKSVYRNPSFSVLMTKYYVRKGSLHIPQEFSKAYLEKGSKMVTLWIKNDSWPVRLVSISGRSRLATGWNKFVEDNCLNPGNLCTFGLFDRTDWGFKVTIS